MSRNDSLTGIANRRRFDAWFAQAFEDARRTRAPLALVLADIDHFKAYNDGYGHLAGDECLRTIAATMVEALAGVDARLARYGGEEFAIVLAATPIGDARAIAERLRLAVQASAVEHRYAAGGQVTISAGVAACIPSDDAVAADLFAAADRALYAAKDAGRNRTVAADGMQPTTP
jgi:diguanylate cyclase (GGDEF)-like protein